MTSEMIQNNEHATWLAIKIARRLMLVDEWIVEDDNKKPGRICPVIQRACIKEQCLAYTFSRFFNGERDQLCYKCSLLNIILG